MLRGWWIWPLIWTRSAGNRPDKEAAERIAGSSSLSWRLTELGDRERGRE